MASERGAGLGFDAVRQIALALPEVEEDSSYGTPAFRVRRKLFVRLREDGESIVVKTDYDEREALMEADPEAFYITDHYVGYPMLVVRLTRVARDDLESVIEDSYRRVAPKRLLAQLDAD
jgi:hypothetical protein